MKGASSAAGDTEIQELPSGTHHQPTPSPLSGCAGGSGPVAQGFIHKHSSAACSTWEVTQPLQASAALSKMGIITTPRTCRAHHRYVLTSGEQMHGVNCVDRRSGSLTHSAYCSERRQGEINPAFLNYFIYSDALVTSTESASTSPEHLLSCFKD